MPLDGQTIVKDVFVHGGGAAVGFVSAEAIGNFARNALQLPPTGYTGLAAEGLIKGTLALAEMWGAEHARTAGHAYIGEGLDYVAAGTLTSFFVDVLRVLGVSPLGSMGLMGHVQPPRVAPAQYYAPAVGAGGPVLYRAAAGPGPIGPGYGTVGAAPTIPVGAVGQVAVQQTQRLKGPGQPIAGQAPRYFVS